MKRNGKKSLAMGLMLILAFAVWTALVQTVDVKPVGQQGSNIGFAAINTAVFAWTGTHMPLYTVTDWLGLVPLFVCIGFGFLGLVQLVRRKSLFCVDHDVLLLGIYYLVVILGYLLFEMIPVNYRPVLIEGRMEASYPSSTTLLVLSVMPTLCFESKRRLQNTAATNTVVWLANAFSVFMVAGRLISGVHWITDIAGGVMLSVGLFFVYKGAVLMLDT